MLLQCRYYSLLSLKVILLHLFLKEVCMQIDINEELFQCNENFCENIVCEGITYCPNGFIKSKAGFCGCCDACVNKTDTITKCRENRAMREQLSSSDSFADKLWKPDCDDEGYFKLKQTKKKKSLCVNKDGVKLFGQDISEFSTNMTCKCSEHIQNLKMEQKITFMIEFQEHCTAAGDYEKIQCIGNICYCASTETGEVEGRIVRKDHIDKLKCYDKKKPVTSYLKSCEKELVRSRKLSYQFFLKGITVVGLEKVECDPDGTFSSTQCDSNRCSCTDEKGVQIKSYFTNEQKNDFREGCDCARDNEKAAMHAQYPSLKCLGNGGYNLTQCFPNDICYCVDEDGDVISKPLNVTTISNLLCKDLLEKLTEQRQIKQTTEISYPTSRSDDPTSETDDYYNY